MKQTRLMSLVEAIANGVDHGIAVVTQLVVFPWFGLPAHLDNALAIGEIFTSCRSFGGLLSGGCSRLYAAWIT